MAREGTEIGRADYGQQPTPSSYALPGLETAGRAPAFDRHELLGEIRYFCEITNFTFAAAPGRTLTACSQVFGSLKRARCTCF